MTQIDELVLVLGLDTRTFSQEQRRALDSVRKMEDDFDLRLKNIEKRTTSVGQSFGDISKAAEGLFTTIAGVGLASFARDAVSTAAATGRMAINIGVATAELSAFGRMIERNGGSAESANASLKGLSDTMQRARWGQTSPEFLMGLSQVGGDLERDTPLTLFFKLSKFAEKNSVQDVNLTGQRLGFDQNIINAALKGQEVALRDYKRTFDSAFDGAQAKKLTDMQEAMVSLGQAMQQLGIDVLAKNAPQFTDAAKAIESWTSANKQFASSLLEIVAGVAALAALKPAAWILRLLGLGALTRAPGAVAGLAAAGAGALGATATGVGAAAGILLVPNNKSAEPNIYENGQLTEYGKTLIAQDQGKSVGGGSGAFKGLAEKEAYIRTTAMQLGIDPDVAMKVAKSEGFYSFKSMIPGETSYGAFQLHVSPGGRARAVGDQFRQRTGLDPSDPATEREGILFALQWAKQNGWRDFHGAKAVGVAEREGIGNVTIGQINLPGVTNAQQFARDLPGAIRAHNQAGSDIANNANTGLRP